MNVVAEVGDEILFMKNGTVIKWIENTDRVQKEETVLQLLKLHR